MSRRDNLLSSHAPIVNELPNKQQSSAFDEKIEQEMNYGILLCRRAALFKTIPFGNFQISEAFKSIRITKDQQYCLDMRFTRIILLRTLLPFGLESAPALFELSATAINSFINKSGVVYIYHYMDDFICVSTEQSALKDYDLS